MPGLRSRSLVAAGLGSLPMSSHQPGAASTSRCEPRFMRSESVRVDSDRGDELVRSRIGVDLELGADGSSRGRRPWDGEGAEHRRVDAARRLGLSAQAFRA